MMDQILLQVPRTAHGLNAHFATERSLHVPKAPDAPDLALGGYKIVKNARMPRRNILFLPILALMEYSTMNSTITALQASRIDSF